MIQKEARKSYWDYLENIVFSNDSGQGNSKQLYSFVKHKKSDNQGIAPLKSEGQTDTDPRDKAQILNKQFQSVFSKPKPCNNEQLCQPNVHNIGNYTMPNVDVDLAGVEKLLANLNPHKAQGPDQISPRILKELSFYVALYLTKIFSSSLHTGIVPDDWRHAVQKRPKAQAK